LDIYVCEGKILSRFEEKGFKLCAIKIVVPTKAQAETHYIDLKEKKFYGDLCKYFSSGPILCMAWQGKGVIKVSMYLQRKWFMNAWSSF
jgi:nucleoside-diphosphate kinase